MIITLDVISIFRSILSLWENIDWWRPWNIILIVVIFIIIFIHFGHHYWLITLVVRYWLQLLAAHTAHHLLVVLVNLGHVCCRRHHVPRILYRVKLNDFNSSGEAGIVRVKIYAADVACGHYTFVGSLPILFSGLPIFLTASMIRAHIGLRELWFIKHRVNVCADLVFRRHRF